VPAPPGMVMLSLPLVSRNAGGVKRRAGPK